MLKKSKKWIEKGNRKEKRKEKREKGHGPTPPGASAHGRPLIQLWKKKTTTYEVCYNRTRSLEQLILTLSCRWASWFPRQLQTKVMAVFLATNWVTGYNPNKCIESNSCDHVASYQPLKGVLSICFFPHKINLHPKKSINNGIVNELSSMHGSIT